MQGYISKPKNAQHNITTYNNRINAKHKDVMLVQDCYVEVVFNYVAKAKSVFKSLNATDLEMITAITSKHFTIS